MSLVDEFDILIDDFNSSAKVIRRYLVSRERDKTVQKSDSAPPELLLASAPGKVRDANKVIFEAMANIQKMIIDPVELIRQIMIEFQKLSCLRWIVHLNIPVHVSLDTPISYAVVAQAAKVPEQQLRQVARMAATSGFLSQPSPNMLAHTPLSARFVTNPLYREAALYQTETEGGIALNMTPMTSKYRGSEKINETAHNIFDKTDLRYFQYLDKRSKSVFRYQAAMTVLGGYGKETSTRHLVEMFDWAGLGEAEVVDVGNSTGHASIALAQAFPKLRFTVQDLDPMIIKASHSPLLAGVKDRIRFVFHDYFQPLMRPRAKASVFLLRLVLQIHSKTTAQTILRNIASVMRPGAVILLNNVILPDAGTGELRKEALERAKSLMLMQAMNGADREEAEFRELVEGAGAGLSVKQVVRREKSALGLVVITKTSGLETEDGGMRFLDAMEVDGMAVRDAVVENCISQDSLVNHA
ncbi:hypothetical protein H2200_008828 [Cladophialophora chaetospira]|uniref:O-methyltransferase C-terminal domain-containing protein n=1 Tax=Cladophialophora chaetospira TaxID=386627 RepID=A0AA39CFN5_9EURO|nr:hypothetical protein H2200_008828 [Cladophialophora chaetospira]